MIFCSLMVVLIIFVFSTCSPAHLPRASAPTILPRPTSPARPRPVPEVSLALSNTTYCTKTIHNSLLADISIHTEEADRGSAGQSEPLTFHWHNVLSIHRSILSGEVREVRWRLGINAEEVDRGKKREQWGGSIEWIVRAWNIEGIQNESKERKKEKERKKKCWEKCCWKKHGASENARESKRSF